MTIHPALDAGRAAVITGAADGVGRAAAEKFASLGMKLCLADIDAEMLEATAAEIAKDHPGGAGDVITATIDVSKITDVERLKKTAYDAFGDVAVLMNNAGIGAGGGAFQNYEGWRKVMAVNLWGVINGVQTFTQTMIDQGTPCAIVNTGSKQGITCPPGNTAYNVTKAGIKVVTEGLQHELRNIDGCKVSAHLLVPGFTYTGIMRKHLPERPPAAWLPKQVADFLVDSLAKGDFYIICPDNDVTREIDNKRVSWSAGDIVENRPPLSRWHDDYKEAFEAHMAS